MKTKRCYRCKVEKPLSEFYTHLQMADGRLKDCIECHRAESREHYHEKRKDPEWREKEKQRGREKYHRLYSRQPAKHYSKERRQQYKDRYPEKYLAKVASVHLRGPEGHEKHHWSYRTEDSKDVLFLPILIHNKYHRYMVYDQEQMQYRTLEGVLLDTREAAEAYYATLEDKD